MRLNFSSNNAKEVFAIHSYEDFSQLMFDTGMGQAQVAKEEANAKIREIFFQILGINETTNRKDIRKAIRRNQVAIFEVIEETVENLLVSGWGANPFFNEFVEIKNFADGDTNEFYVPDECILTVAEVAGNHHDLLRQKLTEGSTFRVKTGWYGIKVYTEMELFMAGRIDWAQLVQKIYEAFDKKINDMLYEAVMSAGDKIVPQSQFVKTSPLSADTKDTLLELIEDVQAATGDEVVIMGTKSALSKLNNLTDVNWISNNMKEERHTTGRVGIWEGTRLVEIPQAFAYNDTSKKLVDNNKLLIMPVGDNKFVKMYNEGEIQVHQDVDGDTNMDKTYEYEVQRKMGIATIIGKKFGVWTITQ